MQDKRKTLLSGAGMALLVAALVGCSTTSSKNDERSEGRAKDDQNITKQVKTALAQEPVYKFDGVEVKTYDGIVQLSGFVNIEAQRHRASQIAVRQDGVNKVVNALTLKPQVMAPTGQTGNPDPRIYSNPDAANPAEPK